MLCRTEAKFVSRKLPLVVVRQLGRVNEGVVVSVGALDDLPANLVFGFLREEIKTCYQLVNEVMLFYLYYLVHKSLYLVPKS